MYRLRLSSSGQRDLDRLQGSAWQRVRDALNALGQTPRPRGCLKLRGGGATYRIRIGDYRAIYDVDDAAQTVTVLRVKHRREAYKNL